MHISGLSVHNLPVDPDEAHTDGHGDHGAEDAEQEEQEDTLGGVHLEQHEEVIVESLQKTVGCQRGLH